MRKNTKEGALHQNSRAKKARATSMHKQNDGHVLAVQALHHAVNAFIDLKISQ